MTGQPNLGSQRMVGILGRINDSLGGFGSNETKEEGRGNTTTSTTIRSFSLSLCRSCV